ncbi:MAG: DinB family protein [Mucilaginibacter sp.]
MNIAKELKAINAALDEYRRQLDTIPDGQFDVTPPLGGWSFAEVYSHIMQATMGGSIMLERCTHKTTKPTQGGVNWLGKYVLFTGIFPPIKTKIPDTVASRIAPQKISKEEAKNLIVKCHQRMEDMAVLIRENTSTRRAQHPRMGMLNANQWFKFIRIHLQHHLKQLERIRKQLD